MTRGRTLCVTLALGVAALSGAAAPAALGHGETTPTIVTVIDRVGTHPSGLEVGIVRDQAARLQVTNKTGQVYEVLAKGGKPFIRIGPRGVEADVHSITWYRSGNPDGQADPPKGMRLGGPARWVRVSRRSTWTWFDHRMHPGTVQVGQQSIDSQTRARLDDWVVPGRFAGRRMDVTGHVEFRPLRGNVTTDLVGPAEPAPGVQAQLLHGRLPGVYLLNSSRRPVTVIGRQGEPFARIGPSGVQVNERSITWSEDEIAKGRRRTPAPTGGKPVWRRVTRDTHYAWLDVRARYPRTAPPDAVTDGTSRRMLDRWQIPIEVGNRRIALHGRTTWVPLPQVANTAPHDVDRSGAIELSLGLAGFLVAAAGALLLRRRAAERERDRQLVA